MAKANTKAKKSTADTAVAHDPVAAAEETIAANALPIETAQKIDQLVNTVAALTAKPAVSLGGDAIDRELARPRRKSAVVSLTDAPEVAAFREALVDGLITVDLGHRVLDLVNRVLTIWSAGRI